MDECNTNDILNKIISQYEYEEDEFLRELETMKEQVREQSPCEERPVLGALCGLVGEISELRRENRALRYRLGTVASPKRGVVDRVGALLDARTNILPKIIGRRTTTLLQPEILNGARERLATPPHKASYLAF